MCLSPCSFALIGSIVASRFKRESRVVKKRINFFFNILSKSGRISPSLIHIFKCILYRNSRHMLQKNYNITLFLLFIIYDPDRIFFHFSLLSPPFGLL